MTKIDIFSGFLGAGKTTLIKKLIKEACAGEKLVLIENEFGDIGIDGGFLSDAGIQITEMNSGCICCSLVGDFAKALEKVLADYAPDRIIIEPSGVGKLSDVIRAVSAVESENVKINSATAVVDAKKCKMYMKNFGEFFNNQIESAGCIVLSHTKGLSDDKLLACVELIRQHNAEAELVSAEWDDLSGEAIRAAMEKEDTLADALHALEEEHEHEHHHHHDEDECDDPDCECHHHHHHHDDDEEHEHHPHHDHGEECSCGCHDHDHHHHHADEVFVSWGLETAHKYTKEELENALSALENESEYGMVLRAKGIVSGEDCWYHFDYTPGESDIRTGSASTIGRLCVIGSGIKEENLEKLFK